MASFHCTDCVFGVVSTLPSICSFGFRYPAFISNSQRQFPHPTLSSRCLVYKRLPIRARTRHAIGCAKDTSPEDCKSWVPGKRLLVGGSHRGAHLCRIMNQASADLQNCVLENWELGFDVHLSAYPNEAELLAFREKEQSNSVSSSRDTPYPFSSNVSAFHKLGISGKNNLPLISSAPRCPSKINYARRILVFVGRALLLFGVGLSVSSPALAKPAASQVNANPAANVETIETKDVKATSKKKEAAAKAVKQNSEKSGIALSDKFWTGISIPDGSRLQSIKKRLDSHPNDIKALAILLRGVMEQKDLHRAITILERLVELEPKQLEWKFLKAHTHQAVGELPMAREGFEELLKLRPLSARALQGLYLVLSQTGDEELGLNCTETALNRAITEKRAVEAGNLRILLGQIYTQKGKFEEAMKVFAMMIEQDPNDFRPYLCQGLVYSLLDDSVKAEEYLEKYWELCPEEFSSQSNVEDLLVKFTSGELKDDFAQSTFKNKPKGNKQKPMKKPFIDGRPQEQER